MPKRTKVLSALEVKRLPDGVHAVGGVAGLCLQVVGPARSWILRSVVGTRRRHIGLGAFPEVSLAIAREKAASARELIRQGIDPVEQRKAAKSALLADQKRGLLFSQAVDLFAPVKAAELSEGKYRDQWRATVDAYAIPELGTMLVQDITLQDILRVLEPIWGEKTVTADKLRRKLNEILDYCTVKGHRTGPNPARWEGNLSFALASPTGVGGQENYPALQLKDLPRFWAALSAREGMGAAALRFQTLTATRAGAIRFMSWSEVDFENRVWTVQPGRTSSKIGRRDGPKRVPLTDDMVKLLSTLPRQPQLPNQSQADLVFWAPRGGALSDATLGKVMRVIHEAELKASGAGFVDAKTGEAAVPHGTRSAFKVWASEQTDYDWDLSEAALWHKLGNKVERAYARTDVLEKRRAMMADWGEYLTRGAKSDSFAVE